MINTYKAESGYAKKNGLPKVSLKRSFSGEAVVANWKQFANETSGVKTFITNKLLSALPESEFARILPRLQNVTLASGEDIYQPHGSSEFLYFPETAVFSQLNILEDGRTVETAMIGNEGITGLSTVLSFCSTTYWTQTLISGSAWRISADAFKQEFSRGGHLQAELLDYMNSYIAQISQRVICNNHHRIEERFSTWLLMLADRSRENKLVLTHDQIAYFLGVHRPSVTCIAQDLRNNGIIDYMRGRIFILDREKLEDSACECYLATSQQCVADNSPLFS
jgi:CRP-like cAMP-binding protein